MNTIKTNLIWIDLEMTGLNPMEDRIIEIATIVTDEQLTILAEGPVLAIHQSDEIMDNLDEWNQTHHSQSGLIDRVKKSQIDEMMAANMTIDFLKKYTLEGYSPICGNSICQDRRFLARYMPNLERYFHYRNLDVSTIKELVNRWYPDLKHHKKSTHQALNDIKDSIEELRYYKKNIFK